MKLNLDIAEPSPREWLESVLGNFDSFLLDHADCERKASAMAMSLVAKYPDRVEIIPELIETGIEELEHFQQVYRIMRSRGLRLVHSMPKDPYIMALRQYLHSGILERFLDNLLIASVVETRGAERFKMIAENIENAELQKFYKTLWVSEAKHGHIFVKMALNYFDEDKVFERMRSWIDVEARVVRQLKIRPALH